MLEDLGWIDILVRITLATACAAVLGIDRQLRDKPAGLRTYMLVSLGAATFTLITIGINQELRANDFTAGDPIRLVAGVVGGIGFLGAGSILQSKGTVEGVTTAAGIWVTGAIGVAAGCGHFKLAVVSTVFGVVILWVLGTIQHKVAHGIQSSASSEKPAQADRH